MMQRIRQVEKEMIYEEFKDRAGEIVSGTVRRFDRSDVILDLGKFEAIMPQRERVVVEDYNVGDRLRAYVVAVENGVRGPEIIVSRSHPNFVRRLFELEVSEIADGTVEIRGIAREAGYRTKIAVWSANNKVDPVGACVGMRGSRVKNIVRELNNEKVDIIRWSSDPKEFVLEALKPAKVKNLTFDTEKKNVAIAVDEDQLSLAIGKKGQNARLTSRLTGWEINIQKDSSATTAVEQKVAQAAQSLSSALPITDEQATTLVKAGFTNLDGLRDADVQDLVDILGIDETKAREIHETVKKPRPATKMEPVSLIDKPTAKPADSVPKVRTTILPPISKLMAKSGAIAPTPPVETPAPPPVPEAEVAAISPAVDQAAEIAPAVEEEPKNIITIKPPIIVKELATELGVKNFQLIKELMGDFNIFVNANQTIEPDVATKIAERHGFVLEKERREKGGGVHKEEKVIVAPPAPAPAKEIGRAHV